MGPSFGINCMTWLYEIWNFYLNIVVTVIFTWHFNAINMGRFVKNVIPKLEGIIKNGLLLKIVRLLVGSEKSTNIRIRV